MPTSSPTSMNGRRWPNRNPGNETISQPAYPTTGKHARLLHGQAFAVNVIPIYYRGQLMKNIDAVKKASHTIYV